MEYATNKTNKKFSGWNIEALNEFTSIMKEVEKSWETQSFKKLELNYKKSKSPIFELVVNTNETLGRVESVVPYILPGDFSLDSYNTLSDYWQVENDVLPMSSKKTDFDTNDDNTENVALHNSSQESVCFARVWYSNNLTEP